MLLVSGNFSDDLSDQVREFCDALINTLDVRVLCYRRKLLLDPNCKFPLFANKLRDLKRRRRKLERSMKIRPLTWQTSISTNLSGIYTLLFLRSVALRIIDQLATFHLFRKFKKKTVVDQSLGHYEENALLSDSQSVRRRFFFYWDRPP